MAGDGAVHRDGSLEVKSSLTELIRHGGRLMWSGQLMDLKMEQVIYMSLENIQILSGGGNGDINSKEESISNFRIELRRNIFKIKIVKYTRPAVFKQYIRMIILLSMYRSTVEGTKIIIFYFKMLAHNQSGGILSV